MANDAHSATERAGQVLHDIVTERLRQDELWGEQNHDFPRWLSVLIEELGEAAKAANDAWTAADEATWDMFCEELRRELVQVAAVAMAMVECLDRRKALFIDDGGCGT